MTGAERTDDESTPRGGGGGDIEGALGRIAYEDTAPRRTWSRRLLTLAAIVGPGLIVMVGDNDAGGVATYMQAGQQYGTSLLWSLLVLIPVLIVTQEMVVRLGAVTGAGHARLIKERFGRPWYWFSVGDLFVINFLTIVTEFIGVRLGLSYFGVPASLSVPLAAAALIAFTLSGSYRRWERFMIALVVVSSLFVPLVLMAHPHGPATLLRHTFVPGVRGGVTGSAVLLLVAILGTTVAPWQLFFQQSNVIDKRITPRWIRYERADTVIGGFITNIAAAGYMIFTAFAVAHTAFDGHFTNAGGVANALRHTIGYAGGALASIILVDASIIGASAVTLATAYAFADTFEIQHSLHRKATESKGFYAIYAAQVVLAAGIVLVPGAPLGLITEYVQVLAGIVLPSAMIFLVLMCNDDPVLGPWVNPRWLNVVTSLIIAVLVGISVVLTVDVVFPHVDVRWLALVALPGSVVVLAAGAAVLGRRRPRAATPPQRGELRAERESWRTPPLALLSPIVQTKARTVGLAVMRAYVVVAVIAVVVKLATHSG